MEVQKSQINRITYPYLEIEIENEYSSFIRDLFELLFLKIGCYPTAYKAMKLIGTEMIKKTIPDGLQYGSGANHIWFHKKNENGEIVREERSAIIYFDPYKL